MKNIHYKLLIHLTVTAIIYLTAAFIMWAIAWIKDLGRYDNWDRVIVLTVIFLFNLSAAGFNVAFFEEEDDE